MNSEFETNERTVKVEVHFHVSLNAAPGPDWTAWAGGDRSAAPVHGAEPPRKSRWLARSVGALSLLAVAIVGVSVVHRVVEGADSRAEFASAAAPRWLPPAPARADVASNERPLARDEAPQGGGDAPRRGTSAFGLH